MSKQDKQTYQATRHSGGSTKSIGKFDTAEAARAATVDARGRRHHGSSTWFTVDKKVGK